MLAPIKVIQRKASRRRASVSCRRHADCRCSVLQIVTYVNCKRMQHVWVRQTFSVFYKGHDSGKRLLLLLPTSRVGLSEFSKATHTQHTPQTGAKINKTLAGRSEARMHGAYLGGGAGMHGAYPGPTPAATALGPGAGA